MFYIEETRRNRIGKLTDNRVTSNLTELVNRSASQTKINVKIVSTSGTKDLVYPLVFRSLINRSVNLYATRAYKYSNTIVD